jgi:hypothetical protein
MLARFFQATSQYSKSVFDTPRTGTPSMRVIAGASPANSGYYETIGCGGIQPSDDPTFSLVDTELGDNFLTLACAMSR